MPSFLLNKGYWMPWAAFVTLLLISTFCIVNIVSFQARYKTYIEKYYYYLSRNRVIQTQNLINAVSQVQNQLTDISATLGLDQLDQGFNHARVAADTFHFGLINLRQLFSKADLGQTFVPDLDDLGKQFDQFYSLGIAMANAYMQSGTLRGNQKMKPFDRQADILRESLDTLIANLEQQVDHWQRTMATHPEAFTPPSGISTLLWLHLMGEESRSHYFQFLTQLVQTSPRNDQRMALSLLAQDLQGHVIQVQQWLTDLAATRGLDGLDAGYAEASKAADQFLAKLPAFLMLVQNNGNLHWQEHTAPLETRFERFYVKGQALAAAYIRGGAKLGNPLMLEFDTMADEIGNDLLLFITPAIQEVHMENYQMDLVYHSLQFIQKALFLPLLLALGGTLAAFLWLASCIKVK